MGSTKLLLLCNGFITGDSAALVPVKLVLPVILHNNMSYTTCTLTDQSSSSSVGNIQSFHHCLMALLQVIPVLQLVPPSRLIAFQYSTMIV